MVQLDILELPQDAPDARASVRDGVGGATAPRPAVHVEHEPVAVQPAGADQASTRDGAAKTAAQAQAVRPAVTISGSAAGGRGVRDELGTKEWMQRRNDAVRKGR